VLCRTRWERQIGPPDAAYRPFVSLHVAAYNEPPDMLIETIQSLEAIDYPDFEIVVIDNNTTDPEVWKPVEAYCATADRVRFVHVEQWPGFKSGALNLALGSHTDPRAEVVGIVDADYLVKPNWLGDLVGWFADPAVAFVQTPQDYREWQGDGYLTACHDAYAYFFATAMRSRNERNSIIFGGTMGLIRRPVLDEVGRWDEWCITEDAEISLRILAAGYQGVYVHRSYGEGIMPLPPPAPTAHEDRRERRPTYQPHLAGATLAVLIAAGIALLSLGGANATLSGSEGFELPRRDPPTRVRSATSGGFPAPTPLRPPPRARHRVLLRTTITTPATTPTSAPGANTASTRPPGSSPPASTAPPGSTSATRPGQAPATVPFPPSSRTPVRPAVWGRPHPAPRHPAPTVGHRCWRQPARPRRRTRSTGPALAVPVHWP